MGVVTTPGCRSRIRNFSANGANKYINIFLIHEYFFVDSHQLLQLQFASIKNKGCISFTSDSIQLKLLENETELKSEQVLIKKIRIGYNYYSLVKSLLVG